ncbi:MAG TPA: hypothetical protein VFJ74_05445 [Gemmatimonadaceae bacterium]|nr:hypothetical protein [Gemmatimonadaceae bacterium]
MLRRLLSAITGNTAPSTPSREVHDVRGFRVVVENGRADISTAAVLARLDEAIALAERYQPWRVNHLRRDLREFWVVRFPCRGAYFPEARACVTELTFLARTDISAAPVAASILHEGMHARVDRMGVDAASRDRAREERICRRAELDFGLALPNPLGAPVVERALASLALDDEGVAPNVDWAEALRRQDAVDGKRAIDR